MNRKEIREKITTIQNKIANAEMELSNLKQEHIHLASLYEDAHKEELVKDGILVKSVCIDCHGTGEVSMGGADALSDPPYSVMCDDCFGKGYHYNRVWSGQKEKHDLSFVD